MIKYFKQDNDLACICLVFEGSNLEKEHELGAAHLLEHLVCRRLDKFQEEFDLHGIEFNASTSPLYTQYYIRGLDRKIRLFAQKFYDAISVNPLKISEEQFKEEKRIIIQEWHDDVSDPENNLMNRFFIKFYKMPGSIGTLKSLDQLTFEQFKKMYRRHYAKPLFCLVEQTGNWKINNHATYKEDHDSTFEFNLTSELSPFPARAPDSPNLMIISDNFQENFTEHFLINAMLSEGLNSPLFKALREQHQLVYALEGTLAFVNPYLAHSKFITTTQVKNKDKVWKVFKQVLNDKAWMSEKRFNQVRERALIEREIELKLNLYSPAQEFLYPNEPLIVEELTSIEYKQVAQVAKAWYQDKKFIFFD